MGVNLTRPVVLINTTYSNGKKRKNVSRQRASSKGRNGNENSAVWNDLQIDQWPEDDNMRKTRAQNDQFWDENDLDVDEYLKQEDI